MFNLDIISSSSKLFPITNGKNPRCLDSVYVTIYTLLPHNYFCMFHIYFIVLQVQTGTEHTECFTLCKNIPWCNERGIHTYSKRNKCCCYSGLVSCSPNNMVRTWQQQTNCGRPNTCILEGLRSGYRWSVLVTLFIDLVINAHECAFITAFHVQINEANGTLISIWQLTVIESSTGRL